MSPSRTIPRRPARLRALLPALACLACGAAAAGPRPNVVFLFTDDQTVGAAGCYGNKDIHTPHLDRLAREGVLFRNHYNTTSICMASRCSVLTGLYEYRHGCNFGHGNLERRFMDRSYHALLRRAGYFTGFAGKIGFELAGEKFEAFEKEFDAWAGGPGQTNYETAKNKGIARYADRYPHCSRAYAAWALDFLKAAKESGKPFCLSISFKAPHLAQDRIEMRNVAGDPACAGQLKTMRALYDAHLADLEKRVVPGHGHEPYASLFSRTLGWERKAPLLKASGRSGAPGEKKSRRKAPPVRTETRRRRSPSPTSRSPSAG